MTTEKLYYGAAYYDEYMPYDRIETDFSMMEAAGMNVIRIAESTWSTWEPQEGQFDFTHLHRMLDCARKHHLSVIVGTPTYAIPSWLARKADDILAVTHGAPPIYGHRQIMDLTSPVYLEHCQIIIERLMQEIQDEPHIIGFQLDNETHHYDTCGPRAQKMFVEYLKEQFPDINEFNREFGLDYWSNRVDNWDDFPDVRGTINQSLAAEYSKFQRQLVTNFLTWQAGLISKYKRPDQFITHNFDYGWTDHSFGLQPETNQYDAAKCMDVAGCDIYHPAQGELTGDEITVCGNIAHGIKRANYLILETEAQGNAAWLPYPGQLRLQAYTHIANGANSVMYWHWHSIHNAIESYWKGVLSHDLAENETYRECSIIGNEWKRIGDQLKNLQKHNRLAIMIDNECLTGLSNFPTATAGVHSYNTILRWIADTLCHMNIEYDIIRADAAALADYDCVILPALYSVSEEFLQAADAYVQKGGNLIVTFKSAFSDPHLKIYHDTQPHILNKALGIHYDQFTIPKEVSVSYHNVTSDAREWMELVCCDSAVPLAHYEHDVWNRYCAVTENTYGNGHTLYLAALFGEDTLREILSDFLRHIAFREPEKLPFQADYPVVVKQGINDAGHRILYYLNYSAKRQTIKHIAGNALDLLTDTVISQDSILKLDPWDVKILSL